jgi:hypothetical protein
VTGTAIASDEHSPRISPARASHARNAMNACTSARFCCARVTTTPSWNLERNTSDASSLV